MGDTKYSTLFDTLKKEILSGKYWINRSRVSGVLLAGSGCRIGRCAMPLTSYLPRG